MAPYRGVIFDIDGTLVDSNDAIAGVEDILTEHTTASDVEASKPEPDIVRAAATKLGPRPEEVLMVGDTPFDVESARKAGVGGRPAQRRRQPFRGRRGRARQPAGLAGEARRVPAGFGQNDLPLILTALAKNGFGKKEYRMTFFNRDIFQLTQDNSFLRQEVLTPPRSQLVVLSVEPGDDIGEEVREVDRVLVFVAGQGEAVLNGERSTVAANALVVVPAGTRHNFIDTGEGPLKPFTVYAPPQEEPGRLHHTKAGALAAEARE